MIRIYTFADKRPDFISLQAACIRMFFPAGEEVKFTVFDNSSTPELSAEIHKACRNNSWVNYFPIPDNAKDHSNPNAACAVPLNWAWKYLISNNRHIGDGDTTIILDSDMFPVAKFNHNEHLIRHSMAGTYQRRGQAKYIWNGIMMFADDCPQDMDFNYGEVAGSITDVGGKTHEWFEKYGREMVKNIHHTSHIHPDNKNMHCIPEPLRGLYDPEFRMEIYADCFLHYGRGSNWDGMPPDYHDRKTKFLKTAIGMALVQDNREPPLFGPHGYVFSENEWK